MADGGRLPAGGVVRTGGHPLTSTDVIPIAVRLPGQLREFAAGQSVLRVELSRGHARVADLLRVLDEGWPAVGRRVSDEQGNIRRHVHVYIGEDRVRSLEDEVPDGAEVTILPAVSGG